MLGDSVKRRTKRAGSVVRSRTKPEEVNRLGRAGFLLVAVSVPLLAGYAFAVLVLFPAPDVAAQGIAVPSLMGKSMSEAQAEIREIGLGTLDVTRLPHPTAAEGTVIAQSPLPGQQLRGGAPVEVAVSDGVPRVSVPNVIDFPADRAAALLTRLGLRVQRTDEPADAQAGRVIEQDPAPGTVVAVPARIVIRVSAGRPPVMDVDTSSAMHATDSARTGSRRSRWPDVPGRSTFEIADLTRMPQPERFEP